MVTDAQVRLLRQKRMEGRNLETAAAAAGMSERTARKWQDGALPSESKGERWWRTREDAFAEVWDDEIVPLLRNDTKGVLEATTLFAVLEEKHPGRFREGQLRTLQRRVRDWRALTGPEREVIFPQEHVPGREAAFDFTDASGLGVTVCGEVLEHLIFELVLSYSGWSWVAVVFAENFETLQACVQGALWDLGGVVEVLRSDNLSAATHELQEQRRRVLTERYQALLDHYGIRSTRIRPGESHENGVVEQAHRRLKSILAQALVLRGSTEFASVEEYAGWVREVVERWRNRGRGEKFAEDRLHLRPLPRAPIPNYTTVRPTVRRWSTIQVAGRTYSVPSRLIGHEVEVRLHPNEVEVRYRDKTVETMARLRGSHRVRINYRHVIWSLVRKPGAFARYRFREELFPSLVFRRAYDALRTWRGERADVEYVRILHLAASTRQDEVERTLGELLEGGERFDYAAVKDAVRPEPMAIPRIRLPEPDLSAYDRLIGGGRQP
jgi:hypothetical protein